MSDLDLINIINELHIDRNIDHLKDMSGKQLLTIPFTINNTDYKTIIIEYKLDDGECTIIYFIDDTEWRKLNPIDFRNTDEYQNNIQKLKMGKTTKGNEFAVFNAVYNIVGKFVEKYKPKYIGFDAYEENRKTLYNKMTTKLQNELINVNYTKININPITNKTTTDKEFYFKRI